MCDISYPVYRRGSIISSEPSLDFNTESAMSVAEKLKRNYPELKQSILDLPNEFSKKHGLQFNVEKDEAKTRQDPTIVVDFPAFEITWGENKIDCRTCITVCRGDKQSKCWARYTLIQDTETKLSDDTVSSFFSDMPKIDNEIERCQISYYSNILNESNCESKLDSHFKIFIKSMVGDDPDIDNYFACRFIDGESDCDNQVIEDVFTRMDPQASNNDSEDTAHYTSRTIGFSVPRITEIDDPESATSRILNSIYRLRYNDEQAVFIGIGYDGDQQLYSELPRRTLSHLSSQRICNDYGEMF